MPNAKNKNRKTNTLFFFKWSWNKWVSSTCESNVTFNTFDNLIIGNSRIIKKSEQVNCEN